jgi:phage repressor protein C with HTH and peptisase S24 domain
MIEDMSTLKERLEEAIAEAGVTKTAIWKACGLSSGAVSQWFSGSTQNLDGENLLNASKVLGVNPEWLATGKGRMKHIDAQISPPSHQAMGDISSPSNIIKIPLLNITASMGYGSENTEEVPIAYISINADWAKIALRPLSDTSNLAFIHAVGDSMFPTFNDGDILLVDTWNKSVTADKIYVIEAHDRLFIKRVRQRLDGAFEVSSDNPSVKTVDILNGDSEVNVKGHVIWVWNGKKI